MDIIPLKIFRSCQIEKPKIRFSGRSAKCCVCMYAKNKALFLKYYEEKHEHLITYTKDKYHVKYDDIPKLKRGRKKIEPIPT